MGYLNEIYEKRKTSSLSFIILRIKEIYKENFPNSDISRDLVFKFASNSFSLTHTERFGSNMIFIIDTGTRTITMEKNRFGILVIHNFNGFLKAFEEKAFKVTLKSI
jgi:hypothetical protein